jgi:dTDP-4-dehydrorhamnose 3,5-epimerase
MNVIHTAIPDVLVLEPKVFVDERGFFFESYNKRVFEEATGVRTEFVQDNHSYSVRNVLRGLHYQIMRPQGKLIRVIAGEVFDVAVDIRKGSPTFGQWLGTILSSENKNMVWIPGCFAHGFLVLSDYAEVVYKTTDYWIPEFERCIAWDDPDIGIQWPLQGQPLLSPKDRDGLFMSQADLFASE